MWNYPGLPRNKQSSISPLRPTFRAGASRVPVLHEQGEEAHSGCMQQNSSVEGSTDTCATLCAIPPAPRKRERDRKGNGNYSVTHCMDSSCESRKPLAFLFFFAFGTENAISYGHV